MKAKNYSVMAIILASLFITSNAWAKLINLGTPTATFAGGALTGFTTAVGINLSTAVAAGTTVNLQYTTGNGTPIGGPIPVKTGPGGTITVPPPPIPPAATGLGNKVEITLPGVGTTVPLVWYNGAWVWGTTPKIKIDPTGLPGLGDQHWFIQDTGGAALNGTDSVFGSRSLSVVDSGFDLSYSPVGGSFFDVFVTGDDSFMSLSDNTYISFLDGTHFGTMNIAPGAASGSFNFAAIGLSGLWFYDVATNYTGGDATTFTPFQAPAITATTPEPGTMALLGLGLGGLFLRGRGKRRAG